MWFLQMEYEDNKIWLREFLKKFQRDILRDVRVTPIRKFKKPALLRPDTEYIKNRCNVLCRNWRFFQREKRNEKPVKKWYQFWIDPNVIDKTFASTREMRPPRFNFF